MVVFTMYLLRYTIVWPILHVNNFELQLPWFDFLLMVFAIALVTGAGYIINDYFDTKTDLINKPGKVIIDKYINRRLAMSFHWIFNSVGISISAYLSFKVGMPILIVLPMLVAGMLWFYSTEYKRQLIVGNLVIAILAGLIPFFVIILEIPLLNKAYKDILVEYHFNFNNIIAWIAYYSLFAFITNLYREIIKDVEDMEGDYTIGRNTIPLIMGVFTAKMIVFTLFFIQIAGLVYLYFKYLFYSPLGTIDYLSAAYFVVFLITPVLWLSFLVYKAKSTADYALCSKVSKVIMLLGLFYSLIFCYNILSMF